LGTFDSKDWKRAIDAHVLKWFRLARQSVPAYRKFLDRMGVDPDAIQGVKDLRVLPPITKTGYLRSHPWDKLCVSGALNNDALVLTATSGSTGQPFYIPRTGEVHEAAMLYHRLFLDRSGLSPKKTTLVVICFGMGVWIGGVLTYEAFRRIAEDGRPLTVITPGVNKKEIFEALTRIGPSYEQVILCGYPPFIKDVIDAAPEHGVDWKRWQMGIVCAAEAFSEEFRECSTTNFSARRTGSQPSRNSSLP
jgi:phenylacetate-CoA ligase